MTINDAENIIADFGDFYAEKRGSLQVLADGTIADDYEDIPYFSVWDLPYSPAKIKYAILLKAEHAIKNGYMDFIPPGDEREESVTLKTQPIGNVLKSGYGLLGDFVEDSYEINNRIREIWQIEDVRKRDVEKIKFEAKFKVNFGAPDHYELEVEFQNFLADLHNNWRK